MKNNWISVEDRLPPLNKRIIARSGHLVTEAQYVQSVGYPARFDQPKYSNDYYHHCLDDVDAWQPLPLA